MYLSFGIFKPEDLTKEMMPLYVCMDILGVFWVVAFVAMAFVFLKY